jgi:putative flippase GtrA
MKDFVRFCIVGALGFGINAAMLAFWVQIIGLPLVIASLLSAEGAFLCTFIPHRQWTYQAPTDKSWQQLLIEFHGSAWAGMLINITLVNILTKYGLHYIVSLALASASVLFWNFAWTKFYIWRPIAK